MEAKYHSLIFDLDGTVVDSALDFSAIRKDLGLTEGEPILETLEGLPPQKRTEMEAILLAHEQAGADRATLMPGIQGVLDKLHRKAILTRNEGNIVRGLLSRLNLSFDPVICRDDAPPKPDPAGLLRIAKAWDMSPGDLAYVGDYHFDLEAAQRAGMTSILYCPGEKPSWSKEADLVIEHFDQLLQTIEGD